MDSTQNKLIAFRASLASLLADLDELVGGDRASQAPPTTTPPPQPPAAPAPAAPTSGARMQNPHRGYVTQVVPKQIPSKAKPGSFFTLWEIHMGSLKFSTRDKALAAVATNGQVNNIAVTITWSARANGAWTNYDVLTLTIN